MMKDKRIICIIPARKGSKGLPGKNKKLLLGKPLISWTFDVALEAKMFDRIWVSTDDEDVQKIALSHGIDVPELRPVELAQDSSPTKDVILHSLDRVKELYDESFEHIVLLEPTSPLREVSDIKIAFKKLLEHSTATSIVGVGEVESQHPVFLAKEGKDNILVPYLNKDFTVKRRQDIEKLYFFEGSLYISTVNSFKKNGCFYHSHTIYQKFDKIKSIEIDDAHDFEMVEYFLKKRIEKNA